MADPELFSCADIARALDRNPTSIWRAIQRLAIPPAAIVSNGHIKLYTAGSLSAISASLRAPNHRARRATTAASSPSSL